MEIGFCIPRMNYLGHFGPLIDFLRNQGDEVFLLCDHRQKKQNQGYKAYLFPDTDKIKQIFPCKNVFCYQSSTELVDIIKQNGIKAIISLSFDSIARDIYSAGLLKGDIFISHIQTGFDLVYSDGALLADAVYVFSDVWRDNWKKNLVRFGKNTPQILKEVDSKAVIVGFPQLDQLKDFDRGKICEKYGLPKDKKILVLLPFPWRVPFGIWSHIIYKPQSKLLKLIKLAVLGQWSKRQDIFTMTDDKKVTAAIRKFADKNSAFFVVKGRLKNRVPDYLAKAADKIIYDESFYPYTIMELLFVADLCIHFYSDAVKECVPANTPSVCLGPKNPNDWECYAERFCLRDFSPTAPSYYNFSSVSYNESVDDFAESFAEKSFEDYAMKPAEKAEFMKKFLGFDDLNSCSRVYEDINRRLGNRR